MHRLRGHSEAPTIRMIKYDVAEQISLMVGENITWKRSIDVLCYPSAMNQDGSWRRIHFGDSLIAIRDLRRVISNSFIRDVLRLNFSNGADFGFWAALSGSIRGLKKVTDIRISGYSDIRISGPQTDFDENERQIPLNSPHTRAAHA